MPVHDLGYRNWTGERVSRLLRPLVVARSGISLVWRNRWLKFMIMGAWLPIVLFGMGIFAFEYSGTNPEARRGVTTFLVRGLQQPQLASEVFADHEGSRHSVWSFAILTFFRVPQLVAMVLLVGIIAPMLISYDLRSKAYLMYFARPLSPMEYILGKSCVLWLFLAVITAGPALTLYVLGVFMSPDLSVVLQTWDIPFRIMAATLALIIPTTALALCYSSFTSESRYATFSWFSTWIMGWVAYRFLTYGGRGPRGGRGGRGRRRGDLDQFDQEILGQFGGGRGGGRGGIDQFGQDAFEQGQRGLGPDGFGNPDFRRFPDFSDIDVDKWRLVSPYDTLGKVQAWIFGHDSTGAPWQCALALIVVTLVCVWIIRRRIVARLSV